MITELNWINNLNVAVGVYWAFISARQTISSITVTIPLSARMIIL
jgi:hypothetical protein